QAHLEGDPGQWGLYDPGGGSEAEPGHHQETQGTMMKVGYRWFLGLVLLIVISGCDTAKGTRVIKLAHGLDVNHSVHKAMLKMGEDLEKLSGGKMSIKIYPNQQLWSERESLELLQIGSLDMTKVSVGVLENFAPDMK